MELKEGIKYRVSCGGKWWYQVKKILKIYKNRAIVIFRPDFDDLNWTGVIENRDGEFHSIFECHFDNSLLDDFDKKQLDAFLRG